MLIYMCVCIHVCIYVCMHIAYVYMCVCININQSVIKHRQDTKQVNSNVNFTYGLPQQNIY